MVPTAVFQRCCGHCPVARVDPAGRFGLPVQVLLARADASFCFRRGPAFVGEWFRFPNV
jgi:hypothetical protein